MDKITIRGAKEHNLKNINLEIPRDKLVVFTGLSGSGKSTLAFDTIYAEGQRRYLESLSSYARQFLGQMEKPNVESIEGLSPAISIDQKGASHNPRSTVGTVTEVYDYLRVLYARIGIPHCPVGGEVITKLSVEQMVERVLDLGENQKIEILSPVIRGRKGEYHQLLNDLFKEGYTSARINGKFYNLSDKVDLGRYKQHDIDVLIDKIEIKSDNISRISDDIEQALKLSQGLVLIVSNEKPARNASSIVDAGREILMNQSLSCPVHDASLPEIEPRIFSFNSPFGACPQCDGLGVERKVDVNLVIPDKTLSIAQGAIMPLNYKGNNYFGMVLRSVAERYGFSEHTPVGQLPENLLNEILYGTGKIEYLQVRHFTHGRAHVYHLKFQGIIPWLERRYHDTESEGMRSDIERYMSQTPCNLCSGARLKKEVLLITVGGKNIDEVVKMSVKDSFKFFEELKLSPREFLIAEKILNEIKNRLKFLVDVGLDYLTLDRAAYTLAGGEAQRIRLASQIGSGLVGVLYILDEPSIGLHARDDSRLLATLEHLRDLGNSVIVIEHDEETMRVADQIVDIGPGAGSHGGEVVAQGTIEDIMAEPRSLTGQYLSGKKKIEIPLKRRKTHDKFISVYGANEHNLKNITVHFPLQVFTAVTGVSGSGKSTLVNDILNKALSRKLMKSMDRPGKHSKIEGFENLNKVITIDQSPIGRTPRSNPATYTNVFSEIRTLFSKTKEAKIRGYQPGRFSFNVAGGRCDNCQGDGVIKIEMHFMPDIFVPCEVCNGKRFNRETLQVLYKEKNIADVLAMTVTEALDFFRDLPKISDVLQTLVDVGLGYIKLGQSATTLSGGEAQRVKLATELARRATGNTLYILDEPTTGLHFEDINKLLEVLHRLVDAGNSVVVIEHNLDVIKTADHIIDLGPEGGDGGGKILATGTPEDIAKVEESYTGQFLAKVFKNSK
ncbi:TPA: excinuclease ABC subunit UvrA [Candidatus Berkelbacteria bacterium]|uniref:UvrABC system protein A n=1 Tax=Berkelbacteria bacterium GW2011_GWE1_39_12 TaxID=1618337 RepID=A0A0G4B4R6_9BACT|nr:MAG: excinuclease ABC subunit A, excinuclease ABC subunit A [Berkelbacteria bacterium GW2011_GWE1_39_12]HBO60615.1 excinuclease ABC subunit UvrA [Candidatus Berkelbacteria bacterium]